MKKLLKLWIFDHYYPKKITFVIRLIFLSFFWGSAGLNASADELLKTKQISNPDSNYGDQQIQKKKLTGTVYDEEGKPIPGATLMIKYSKKR